MPVLAQSQDPAQGPQSTDDDDELQPVAVTAQRITSAADSLSEIIVQAARTGNLAGVQINFGIPYPQEQLWAIYPGNQISYLGSNNGHKKGNVGENRVKTPSGFIAIAHTHPSWASSAPGPGDWGQSFPLYGITPAGVWVIWPGATSATWLYGQP